MDAPAAGARARPAPEPRAEVLRKRLVHARFEALAEWGMPLEDARVIAHAVDVDIVQVVGLLRHGCPADLVLSILA